GAAPGRRRMAHCGALQDCLDGNISAPGRRYFVAPWTVARTLLSYERGGASVEAVSSLLMVAVKICYASSILFVRNYGILDAQILDRWWYLRLETASRTVSAGKEVR